jgi:radical SAM superfamily enzyme YgiQ (UPF0313 family)
MYIRPSSKNVSILLVNYAGYPSSPNSLLPDNGLASLASILKEANHKVKIMDYSTISTIKRLTSPFFSKRLVGVLETFQANKKTHRIKLIEAFLELKLLEKGLQSLQKEVEKKIAEEISITIKKEKVDLLGFKLWNGDGFFGPVRIAKYLKKWFPNILIAAGGPQVKFFREHIFDITRIFDVLAVGDGETTILPLTEVILGRKLSEVPNIYYLDKGRPVFTKIAQISDMNSLPFPIYDEEVYPVLYGHEKIRMLVVEDRRGCENLCHFCVHPFISGKRARSKTPEKVASEFQSALENYNILSFRLGGSSSPTELLLGIAHEIEKKGINVHWSAFARIKDSRPEDFLYLRSKGLYSLFFGIESGNQQILDKMNKGTSPEMIKNVIAASKEAGIFTVGSIIYPAPFDTQETRRETLELLKEIRPDSVPLQFLGIFPGTEYANHPEKHNIEIVYPSRFSNLLSYIGLKKKPEYYDSEIIKYLIKYKIKLLFPPKFWASLPWKINGLTYRKFATETQTFYEDLEKEDILCRLTDDEALMAYLGGYTPKEFTQNSFIYSFTRDWEGMSEMVKRINEKSLIN